LELVVKKWLLKLLKSAVKTVVDEALTSAKKELDDELVDTTMFTVEEKEIVEQGADLLVHKVIAEVNKRL
jgi:hypothetical protein